MDWRATPALVLCLLACMSGCEIFPKQQPKQPGPDIPPPGAKITKKKYEPMKPDTLVALGNVRRQQALENKDAPQQMETLLEEARKSYTEAIHRDAKHVPAYLGLARLYEDMDDHQHSVEYYHKALKLVPEDAGVYYELGMMHARHKEWEPALEHLQQATELQPSNKRLQRSFALALARAGRIDECLREFKKVMSEADAHYMAARMLHHLNKIGECRHHAQVALQLEPAHPEVTQFLKHLDAPESAVIQANHETE